MTHDPKDAALDNWNSGQPNDTSVPGEVERLREALRLIPDEIEVFRLMRRGGRSRMDQAQAVAARIEEIRDFAFKAPATPKGE